MQSLHIDPPAAYVLPADKPIAIVLVGCGGTGSHIAQSLARLAVHMRATSELNLYFIDGDTVEPKNVGRQLFSAAEVGRNKAQTLAARFSAAMGLNITAIPHMADADLRHVRLVPRNEIGIIVGAIDRAAGRQACAEALRGDWHLWLDCGNHETSGQVVVGTALTKAALKGALAIPGLCRALPAPSLVYPDLLRQTAHRPRADCAAAQEDNAQSLMVNQMMAAIAAEYLYNLVVRRRLTTFATSVDLASLTMQTQPITARALAQATGMDVATLTAAERKVA